MRALSLVEEVNTGTHQLVFGLWLGEIIWLGHEPEFNQLIRGLITAMEHPRLSLEKYNHMEACKVLKQEAVKGDDELVLY